MAGLKDTFDERRKENTRDVRDWLASTQGTVVTLVIILIAAYFVITDVILPILAG